MAGGERALEDGDRSRANNVPPDITERMTMQTVAGNYVLLEIGKGKFAFYGHLAPGSLTVREGERVRQGTTIARIGNSGNSTGPHLHFHLTGAPAIAGIVGGAHGIPFVFHHFEQIGRITREQFDATDHGVPIGPFESRGRQHILDLPVGGSVVNFCSR